MYWLLEKRCCNTNALAYVELQQGNGKFKRENVKIGISDGINVEILKGIKEGDKIKVWNKASDDNKDDASKKRKKH
jgi:HlyD family secretion protein